MSSASSDGASTIPSSSPPPSPFVPLAGGFVLNGVAAVLLGPLIPVMSPRWQVEPSEVAVLFLSQFVGSAVGSWLSSRNLRRSLLTGYALIAVGFLGLAFAGWPLAVMAGGLLGLGLGLTIPSTNLWLALTLGSRRGSGLAALNFVWGLGATLCPLIFALEGLGVETIPLLSALAVVALGVVGWLATELGSSPAAEDPQQVPKSDAAEGSMLRARALPLLAVLMFLYVGAETALGGWLVTLSEQLGDSPSMVSMLIGSGFWGAILMGRGLAILLLRKVEEAWLYRASLALALTGVVMVLAVPTRGGIATAALLAGLGLAPLFPLHVSFLTAATARDRARGTGWVFACAAVGGGTVPWLTAQLSGETLRSGFVVPLLALMVMVAAFEGLGRRAPQVLVGGRA